MRPIGGARSGIVGSAGSAGSAIPDSGVSRWTFDSADTNSGTAIDVWGSNDGAINGVTTGVSGANQTYTTDEAYSFSGFDHIDIPNNIAVFDGQSDFSFATWIKVPSGTSFGSKGRYVISMRGQCDMGLYHDQNNSGILTFQIFDGSKHRVTPNTDFADGSWHHIGIVWNTNSGMRFYQDGSQVDSNSYTGTANSLSGDNAIGSIDGTGRYFLGDMDDPRLYSKPLTSTEYNSLYNSGRI